MAEKTDWKKTRYDLLNPGENSHDSLRKTAYHLANVFPVIGVLKSKSKILEIGPGKGELLELLKQKTNFELFGFEVCEPYAVNLVERGFEVVSGPSVVSYFAGLSQEVKFDAVLMVDVLEHIPRDEIVEILRVVHQRLNKGGVFYIQVPNISGVFGGNTFFADPTHITAFNEIALQKLLQSLGFENLVLLNFKLPAGALNFVRTALRNVFFFGVRALQRIFATTPIKVLTHNLVLVATK